MVNVASRNSMETHMAWTVLKIILLSSQIMVYKTDACTQKMVNVWQSGRVRVRKPYLNLVSNM